MSVSRQDVINCYRYIAGREPESEKAIAGHLDVPDVVALHGRFYNSPEYKKRHPGLRFLSRKSQIGGVETIALDWEPSCCTFTSLEHIESHFHEAVHRGRSGMLLLEEGTNQFCHKAVNRESLMQGELGGSLFFDVPYHVEVGESFEKAVDKKLWSVWDKWKQQCPNLPLVPLLSNGIVKGMLFVVASGEKFPRGEREMKLDIDRELFQLVSKYGIYHEEPDLLEFCYEKYASVYLNEMFESLPLDGAIALAGATEATRQILDRLSPYNRGKISYCLSEDRDMAELTKVSVSQLRWHVIRTVILTDYSTKEDTKKVLREKVKGTSIKVIDPYDYLRRKGVLYGGALPPRKDEFHAVNYVDINNALYAYESCGAEDRAFYLRKVIAYCVDVRNFVYAKKYMQEYISAGWHLKELYEGFLEDLDEMFFRIKQAIAARGQGDIIVNWVDFTSADEFYATRLAEKIKEKSLFFTRAYTNTPWTHYTYRNIFLGKLPISGKTYDTNVFTPDNSPLLAKLQKHGYEFRFVANPGVYQGAFPTGRDVLYNDGKATKNLTWTRSMSDCSSRLQWMALGERLKSEAPLCLWIHDLTESHPYYGVISTESLPDDMSKHERGLAFLDEQLVWYEQFRNDRQHDVFFSDHGPHLGEAQQKFYGNLAAHIAMIVRSPKVRSGRQDGLYSHVSFARVIECLLDCQQTTDLTEVCQEYILGENPDYGNLKDMNHYFMHKRIQLRFYQQFYIRTSEDLYVKYVLLNKELYYRGDDESHDLLDNPMWQKRIEYLRSLVPNDYIDINKEPRFKECYRLYDFFKTFPSEEIPW